MNFNLITEQPFWFIIFCLLAGAVYTFILYRKETILNEVQPWLRGVMAFFRFFTVSLLAFLLLGPLLRSVFKTDEKPIIVIAQDNSESVLIGTDSTAFNSEVVNPLTDLSNALSEKYEVRTLSFGENTREGMNQGFSDKLTNISELFEQLGAKYENRNVGAVVIASDGLYNQGSNPAYSLPKFKVPFYPIALGDTIVRKDLVLSNVRHNKVAFLGNTFPFEVIINARQCGGEKSLLTISNDSAVVYSKNISISGNNYYLKVPVFLDAKEKGIQKYTVRLSELDDEISTSNNTRNVFIEVSESKQKILVLVNAPHPDVSAFKSAVESNQNYEVDIRKAKNFSAPLNDYNLVVLHGLPSANNKAANVMEQLKRLGVSQLFIVSNQTAINDFNALNTGLTITESKGKVNEVLPLLNSNFSLFTLDEKTSRLVSNFPPLTAPFGTYKASASNYSLMNQKIGVVNTDNPLVLFNVGDNNKTGVIAGEGLWRWKLFEYSDKNSHEVFNELMIKMVQYLSIREKKSSFRVNTKTNFNENEPLIFDAKLYNESDELINEPEVRLNIKDGNGKSYPFTFSKTEKAYSLNAGYFPVGYYRYTATTKIGEQLYSRGGEFSISALQLETAVTVADHTWMQQIANETGGELLYPSQINQLNSLITSREDIVPVTYMQDKLKDLINLKWVFFLLVILLSIEWFLRKRSGAY
ncbi:MAG: hypothetical protein HKN75_11380 [Bacteroidia bacterium]|nr:hypothetical protein [Bacteroidia bacterium]